MLSTHMTIQGIHSEIWPGLDLSESLIPLPRRTFHGGEEIWTSDDGTVCTSTRIVVKRNDDTGEFRWSLVIDNRTEGCDLPFRCC